MLHDSEGCRSGFRQLSRMRESNKAVLHACPMARNCQWVHLGTPTQTQGSSSSCPNACLCYRGDCFCTQVNLCYTSLKKEEMLMVEVTMAAVLKPAAANRSGGGLKQVSKYWLSWL